MTDPELQGITAQALNLAKRDLNRGKMNFVLMSYHQGEGVHRMTEVEALIIARLGENWLNHGRSKDIGFSLLRTATDMMPPDAVVFVTGANMFKPTERLLAMGEAAQEEISRRGHDGHHQAVKDGLLSIRDALVAIAQTPKQVCMYNQPVTRGEPFSEPPRVDFLNQDEFDGRMKMFGHGKHSCEPINFTRKS